MILSKKRKGDVTNVAGHRKREARGVSASHGSLGLLVKFHFHWRAHTNRALTKRSKTKRSFPDHGCWRSRAAGIF